MPGLHVTQFAAQLAARVLQRIALALVHAGLAEPVGDLVQFVVDVVHALLETAHVAADFVAMLLGGMHPQAVVVAGKEAGDGLRRAHAEVLAPHAALPETARRGAVLEQPAFARRPVGRDRKSTRLNSST